MADFTIEKWLSTLTITPTEDGGIALNDNFEKLEGYYGPTTLQIVDPTVAADQDAGYWPWSWWYNTVNQSLWLCIDNTNGAAVWRQQSGNQNPTVQTVQFDTALATPAHSEGLVFYDANNNTFTCYIDNPDVALQLGKELWDDIRNATGLTIANGVPVYSTGSILGGNALVDLADASSAATARCLGLTTHELSNNEDGYATRYGFVRSMNTSAWAAGTWLYLSETAGELTSTPPVAPAFPILIGEVRYQHATQGEVFVFPQWVDPMDGPVFHSLDINTTLNVTGVSTLSGGVAIDADDTDFSIGDGGTVSMYVDSATGFLEIFNSGGGIAFNTYLALGAQPPTAGTLLRLWAASGQKGVSSYSPNSYGVEGISTSSSGIRGTSTTNTGVYGESAGSGFGVYAVSASGVAIYGTAGGTGKLIQLVSSATDKFVVENDGAQIKYGTFAEIYVDDNATATSVATGAGYTKIDHFDSNGASSNCTSDATNDKITVTRVGKYKVIASTSIKSGTANIVALGSVFWNGVEQNQIHYQRKISTAGDVGAATASGIVNVTSVPTDIDFRMRHDNAGAVNITLVYGNITAEYLGE